MPTDRVPRIALRVLPMIVALCWAPTVRAERHGTMSALEQLAQWEVRQNTGLDRASLERMALAVLQRARLDRQLQERIVRRLPKTVSREALASLSERADLRREIVARADERLLREIASQPFLLSYHEIPLAKLEAAGTVHLQRLHGVLRGAEEKSLLFERDGARYVRWPVHPLAETPPQLDVDLGPLVTGSIEARFTASRTLVAVDRAQGVGYFLKLSLPRGVGAFKDKHLSGNKVAWFARVNTLLKSAQARLGFRHVHPMFEPLSLAVQGPKSDAGWIIRSGAQLARKGRLYLPAFSALTDDLGAKIARANGAKDVAAFWQKHLVEPIAQLSAELFAKTGMVQNSPHSQNFVVELDARMRPTGRVLLRDFDFDFNSDLLRATSLDPQVANASALVDSSIHLPFQLTHGLARRPRWLAEDALNGWREAYYRRFNREFARVTGVPSEGVLGRHFRVYMKGRAAEYLTLGQDDRELRGRGFLPTEQTAVWLSLARRLEAYAAWRRTLAEAYGQRNRERRELAKAFPAWRPLIMEPGRVFRSLVETGHRRHGEIPGEVRRRLNKEFADVLESMEREGALRPILEQMVRQGDASAQMFVAHDVLFQPIARRYHDLVDELIDKGDPAAVAVLPYRFFRNEAGRTAASSLDKLARVGDEHALRNIMEFSLRAPHAKAFAKTFHTLVDRLPSEQLPRLAQILSESGLDEAKVLLGKIDRARTRAPTRKGVGRVQRPGRARSHRPAQR